MTAERITLKREGVIGHVAQRIYGNSINRVLFVQAFIGIVALGYGIWSIVGKNYFAGSFFSLIGAFYLRSVILSRNNSAANIIERSSAQLVEAHTQRPPFTRAYFLIHFIENGEKRKRMIMLPGSLSGGNEEYKKAIAIMQEMGWYNT